MKKFAAMMSKSINEFKDTKNLTICSMLAALAVILGYFTIRISDFIKIGFSGIPNQIVACLFGPAAASVFGGALDIIKFIANPDGTYFPGFTISAIVAGIIYGAMYYGKNPGLIRVLIASLIVNVIVNIGLNTIWLAIMYGYDGMKFLTVLKARAIKNLVMTPIDAAVFWTVMRPVGAVIKKLMPGRLSAVSRREAGAAGKVI